jgi:primosomal protein N' (replication factor Y)
MSKTILGTATPLIADYYICKQHNAVIELNELAIQNDKTASIKLIDLKDRDNFARSRMLSNQLIKSIQASLQNHTQSLIFHNRRGSAPLTVCDQCGWQSLCESCFLPLVLHADEFKMRCHTCGRTYPVPTSCPECQNASIHHKGFGTKAIEDELHRLFPHAKIARFDADTDTAQTLDKVYDDVRAGNYDIVVGTQMIAKGFDFPKLTTLGVVQADSQLSLPDFSSEERSYQLITQVIGRAKRGHQNSQIIIQSYQPENPIIQYAVQNNYTDFYSYLLDKRHKSKLPPYTFLLKFSMTYKTETAAVKNIRTLYKKITQYARKEQIQQLAITPPMPAFHERTGQGFTWQIVLKAKSRADLLKIFDAVDKSPYLHFTLDPITLL